MEDGRRCMSLECKKAEKADSVVVSKDLVRVGFWEMV